MQLDLSHIFAVIAPSIDQAILSSLLLILAYLFCLFLATIEPPNSVLIETEPLCCTLILSSSTDFFQASDQHCTG